MGPIMDDFEGLLRLNLISGIGIKTYRNLIEHLGSVKSILDCPKSRLEKSGEEPMKVSL